MKEWLGRLAAIVLGVVLLVAAYAKALDPQLFASQLSDLLPLGASLALPLAIVIVGYEAGLGAALVRGWRHPLVLAATTATFVVFVGVVAWYLVQPNEPVGGCGCFGQLVERTPLQALYEDLAFVALSGLAWLGRHGIRHVALAVDAALRRRRHGARRLGTLAARSTTTRRRSSPAHR
jgi:hypothetical protein